MLERFCFKHLAFIGNVMAYIPLGIKQPRDQVIYLNVIMFIRLWLFVVC